MMEQNVFVENATTKWDGVFNQISFDQVKKGSDPYCFSSFEQGVVPYSHERKESVNKEIKKIVERTIGIHSI